MNWLLIAAHFAPYPWKNFLWLFINIVLIMLSNILWIAQVPVPLCLFAPRAARRLRLLLTPVGGHDKAEGEDRGRQNRKDLQARFDLWTKKLGNVRSYFFKKIYSIRVLVRRRHHRRAGRGRVLFAGIKTYKKNRVLGGSRFTKLLLISPSGHHVSSAFLEVRDQVPRFYIFLTYEKMYTSPINIFFPSLVRDPTAGQRRCQSPKPILLSTGEVCNKTRRSFSIWLLQRLFFAS